MFALAGATSSPLTFSELEVWYFENGYVSGWISVNTAGHTGGGVPYTRVFGKFLQDKVLLKPPGVFEFRPTGAISTWMPDVSGGNHFWDYFFVLSSDLEGQIIVADCLPRPATGSGMLYKMGPVLRDVVALRVPVRLPAAGRANTVATGLQFHDFTTMSSLAYASPDAILQTRAQSMRTARTF
jgi:hypothetical protein